MLPTATVLGCGPAGLLTAHALVSSHLFANVRIISRKVKSEIRGAQYLHREIPGIYIGEPARIKQVLMGTAETYARRVYAEQYSPLAVNSAVLYSGSRQGYDMRLVYDELWEKYSELITYYSLENESDVRGVLGTLQFPYVFCSIPRRAVCVGGHRFDSKMVYASASDTLMPNAEDNTILLNGLKDSYHWYRMSKIFGFTTMEWPAAKNPPPFRAVGSLEKPLRTDCDCWPDMQFVGRYGRWEKGVLADSAFYDTWSTVQSWLERALV